DAAPVPAILRVSSASFPQYCASVDWADAATGSSSTAHRATDEITAFITTPFWMAGTGRPALALHMAILPRRRLLALSPCIETMQARTTRQSRWRLSVARPIRQRTISRMCTSLSLVTASCNAKAQRHITNQFGLVYRNDTDIAQGTGTRRRLGRSAGLRARS